MTRECFGIVVNRLGVVVKGSGAMVDCLGSARLGLEGLVSAGLGLSSEGVSTDSGSTGSVLSRCKERLSRNKTTRLARVYHLASPTH